MREEEEEEEGVFVQGEENRKNQIRETEKGRT